MFKLKKLPLAIALVGASAPVLAAINIDLKEISTGDNLPFQTFQVDIESDIELKYLEYFPIPAQYCSADFFPFVPESISGKQHQQNISFNYAKNRQSQGESICIYVEDTEGNNTVLSSTETINLSPPSLNVSQAGSEQVDSHYSQTLRSGQTQHLVDFIFRENLAGQTIHFNISGNASAGVLMSLESYRGEALAQAEVGIDGNFSLSQIPLALSSTSVSSGIGLNLVTRLASEPSTILASEPLSLRGSKVEIEILQTPQDPIDESNLDSGRMSWDLHTPLSINHTRVLLFSDASQCLDNSAVPRHSIDVSGRSFNFSNKEELLDNFACLQIEDDEGRVFNQAIGWIRLAEKPNISINDTVEETQQHSDTFDFSVSGASNVQISYLSDQGTQNREHMVNVCQQSTSGLPLDTSGQSLIISASSLHDRYICLNADNGLGGKTSWLSQNKLNLVDGIAIVANTQPRLASTPYPTHLAIPTKLQNSTAANNGCRSVFIARDILMSAGHCAAPFFHPANGVWARSPHSYSVLAAQDEKENQKFTQARTELYDYYQQNAQAEGLDYNWLRTQLADIADLNQYHSSNFNTYFSPYFGGGITAGATFADFNLRELETPYAGNLDTLEFAPALVYTYPASVHLTAGEFRSHGIHPNNPNSGWRGGKIHVLSNPGTSMVEYTLVETAGGESGSALWTYDADFETYGVIGAVRGGGAWSSLWSHGRVTRQALADSRNRALNERRDNYQGKQFSYRNLRQAIASADANEVSQILDSGIDANADDNQRSDGWALARAIDFAVQAKTKLDARNNAKHQAIYQQRLAVIKALMLGGADPRLNVIKPTRYMTLAAGDSVLHYAVRTNNSDVLKAIWLNVSDYAFESDSLSVQNHAGDTPLHVAVRGELASTSTKLLFSDVGANLWHNNNEDENPLQYLLNLTAPSEAQIRMLDWIGKAYLYTPVSITENASISASDWKALVCYQPEYQGGQFTFNELAQLRQHELNPAASAAIARLGNISGVDASRYCND